MPRLPREAFIDGAVRVQMILFRLAAPTDNGPTGEVKVHAAALLVRVEVREDDVTEHPLCVRIHPASGGAVAS